MNAQEMQNFYSECYDYEPLPSQKYAYFLELLNVEKGKKLLDIACGQGELLQEAEKRGLEGYGVDISRRAVQAAKQKVKGEIKIRDVNLGLDYPDDFFDYITCLGSLEHFVNQSKVLQEVDRVAKEKAKICIYVPNEDYILHKFGYETDSQPIVNRYSLKGWIGLLQSHGFHVQKVLKDNRHLENLDAAGKGLKRLFKIIFKILFRPFVPLLPLDLSYCFTFICEKG